MEKQMSDPCTDLCPWQITLFRRGFLSVAPMAVTVKDHGSLRQLFSRPPVRPARFVKKRLPCWSPALYDPGDTRANANVRAVTALVKDFDHGKESPEVIAKALR